jgi:Leucine-rich repeat (LRR) protein
VKQYKISAVIVTVILVITMIVGCAASDGLFPDRKLEIAIRDALGLFLGEEIAADNLASLTLLSAPDNNIADLSGIENCINLNELVLSGNNVSDVFPVYELSNLVILNLEQNDISQIPGPCSLVTLTALNLNGNKIDDISAFSSLSNLVALSISGNLITDLTPLEQLLNLARINLNDNRISDISPLLENRGLGEGDEIFLRNNSLDLTEGSEDLNNIRILEGRGVKVNY